MASARNKTTNTAVISEGSAPSGPPPLRPPAGPARGRKAVIGVHQHDHDRHHDCLEERPDQIRWDSEGAEVVVIDPSRLAIHERGCSTAPPNTADRTAHAIQRDHYDHRGHYATRWPGRPPLATPITSRASISSLMRIAPSWAVAPAPIVACQRRWPAITGPIKRVTK